jgi:hypothetical protein
LVDDAAPAQGGTHVYSRGDFGRPAGRRASLKSVLLWVAAAGCANLAPLVSAHVQPAQVTYLNDVAPILQRRCAGCHGPGGVTPALDSYERAREWARGIRAEVLQRRMPPWPAATGLGDYTNDPRPTPIEVEVLTAWADGGTPLGSAGLPVGTIVPTATREAARIVRLPRAHPSRGPVERLRVPLSGDSMWITGWEYRPVDLPAIEQVHFFVDGSHLGSWVPPDALVTYPVGVALPVRRGGIVTAELHYRKSRSDAIDPGTLRLYSGPAGDEPRYRTLVCGTTTLQQNLKVLSIAPAASEAGAFVEVVARRPDQSVEAMTAVMHYVPTYPATYRFRSPVNLPRGTEIDVRSSAPGCNAAIDFIATPLARVVLPRP